MVLRCNENRAMKVRAEKLWRVSGTP